MTLFAPLDHELYLAKRLGDHGAGVFTGLTDPAIRRERIRAAILEHGLELVILGRGKDKKPESYAQVFERLYGEPLNGSKRQPRKASAGVSAPPEKPTSAAPARLTQPAPPAQLTIGEHP